MKSIDFFATHPVFNKSQFIKSRSAKKTSFKTVNNLLDQHVHSGNIIRIRRGMYASISRGRDPQKANVDPYLIASSLTDDSVVAYHSALQFHSLAYSIWDKYYCFVRRQIEKYSSRGIEIIPVLLPKTARNRPDMGGGIKEMPYMGGVVRVTTLERTLVDAFESPEKMGGWEEIWRSLEAAEFFDIDAIFEHASLLASDVAMARIGFYLEQHREQLMLEEKHIKLFESRRLVRPTYFDRRQHGGRFVSRWNLIVPLKIINKGWEEPDVESN